MATVTRALEKISRKQILQAKEAEVLYTRWEIKQEYKALAKKWHPDVGGDAQVFEHIHRLYVQGMSKIDEGKWSDSPELAENIHPNKKVFRSIDTHKDFELRFHRQHKFELGEVFIGSTNVTYAVEKEHRDLFENGLETIRTFPYADDKMKTEMSKFLPRYESHLETKDRLVLVIGKHSDQIYLPDLLEKYSGKLPTVGHLGWFINVLLNLSCYMKINGITHNDISVENYFVDTVAHTGMLGSWWYSRKEKTKLLALPEKSMINFPPDILREKHADFRGDLDCIRALGRQVLGDMSGATLQWNPDLPKPITKWLMQASQGDALADYRYWKKTVLIEAFGKPKYVDWLMTSKILYGQH